MKKKQTILDVLGKKILYFDGGTGTALQSMGLAAGTPPEILTIENPALIGSLHKAYLDSGADIIKTNTFGVNCSKYENYGKYIKDAIKIARDAADEAGHGFVALDVGPLGRMLRPFGDLDFEDAVAIFSRSIEAAEGCGADLILIETMTDLYETKAAVLAAKEHSTLPIFVTLAFDGSGKLLTGADAETVVTLLEGLSVDALGVNCSLGPDKLLPVVERMCAISHLPIIVNPNAGLPTDTGDGVKFDIDSDEFARLMVRMAELGASVLGGCCGTTPEYIKKTVELTESLTVTRREVSDECRICSYTHALTLGHRPLLIGERINPTGKPKLKEALRSDNMSYVVSEAISEEESGAHILDVNVGLPEIDEPTMMCRAIYEIQSVCDLPLQIDSGNAIAIEAAARIYNGKPLINSVNGKTESMSAVFPIVKKYGGAVIALTMDENGIPKSARERFEIAERIVLEAKKYGIPSHELIFDPLALTVSSDKDSAKVTLETVRMLSDAGYMTSLGVSNVSFGLPARDKINSAFFTLALSLGLDLAIINPHSRAMMDAYRAYLALAGMDDSFAEYIAYSESEKTDSVTASAAVSTETLHHAIVRGVKASAQSLAAQALSTREPLEIINSEIIPALTEIGDKFEAGRAYLPELLMSAEAAGLAFSEIKKKIPTGGDASSDSKILLATVKGDIHDIGKNIVKTVLESYGYSVVDLGRDVAPERIAKEAERLHSPLVGLSALMTTTVPAMAETVELIHRTLPECMVMVGGAVLTEEYARMINADAYAKDAMGAVKIAKEIIK